MIVDLETLIPVFLEYIYGKNVETVNDLIIKKLLEFKLRNKDLELYIYGIDNIIQDLKETSKILGKEKQSLYYNQLLKLSERDTTFANSIHQYVETMIQLKYEALKEMNNNMELFHYISEVYLAISSDIMDGYTIARMFHSIKMKDKQIILYFGGNAHAQNIIDFCDSYASSLIKLGSIGISKDLENPKRCLESDLFPKIFQPWLHI